MKTTQTNQAVLFQALTAIVLPQHQPAALARRRADVLRRVPGLLHVATLPVPFRKPGEWKHIPGNGLDWALMPIQHDPLFHDKRGYPIPRPIIRRLETLKRAGVGFDQLWIAHELRKDVRPGQPLTVADLMPAPKPKRPSWVWGALIGLTGMAVHAMTVAMDPILFGVNVAPATTLSARPSPQPAPQAGAPRARPVVVAAAMPVQDEAPTVESAQQPVVASQPQPEASPHVDPPPAPSAPVEEEVRFVRNGEHHDTYYERILSDGRVQRVPTVNVREVREDGTIYIKHDVSRRPTETPDGRLIYPDENGYIDPAWLDRCYLDPILFGVNVVHNVADLFVLGAWTYGD